MLPLLCCALLAAPAEAPPKNPFVFENGDRVVFLGGTLIEREQKYGYWELALTLLNRDKNVIFRNMGWSGDTVYCESRGSFDGPKKGYENTMALLKELKPTVVVICYGHVESFDGEAGVKKFTEGLEKLIDGVNATKARVVLMTPTPFENIKPLKEVDKKNLNLKLYCDAMKDVATKRKLDFVDVFDRLDKSGFSNNHERNKLLPGAEPHTENGVHLHNVGYLDTGDALLADTAAKERWLERFSQPTGSTLEAEKLRCKIVAKNELFFHRWRPQNHTYLFGFRKHEQGQNGKEIVEFDPLIEKAEKSIAELKAKLTKKD